MHCVSTALIQPAWSYNHDATWYADSLSCGSSPHCKPCSLCHLWSSGTLLWSRLQWFSGAWQKPYCGGSTLNKENGRDNRITLQTVIGSRWKDTTQILTLFSFHTGIDLHPSSPSQHSDHGGVSLLGQTWLICKTAGNKQVPVSVTRSEVTHWVIIILREWLHQIIFQLPTNRRICHSTDF